MDMAIRYPCHWADGYSAWEQRDARVEGRGINSWRRQAIPAGLEAGRALESLVFSTTLEWFLRVVTLADGRTIHSAFPDRRFGRPGR
jgi:hypothetical protein